MPRLRFAHKRVLVLGRKLRVDGVFAHALTRGYCLRPATEQGYLLLGLVYQGMDELWGPLLATARARRLRVVFLYRRDLLRMLVSIAHNKRQFDAHPKDEAGLASIRSAKIPLREGRALLSQLDELASHFEAMASACQGSR